MCRVAFDPQPDPQVPAAFPFSAQLMYHMFAKKSLQPPLKSTDHAPLVPVITPLAPHPEVQPLLKVSVQKTVCDL
jgi:hypothetical protein